METNSINNYSSYFGFSNIKFFVIKPQYEATTKLFIGKQESQDNNAYNNNDVMMYQQLMKTYAELAKTSDLVTKAVKSADLDYNQKDIKAILKILMLLQVLKLKY